MNETKENQCSRIIWNAIKKILESEGENVSFFPVSEGLGYSITPHSIRWKNFFLCNSSWDYEGDSQHNMIIISDVLKEITKDFDTNTVDVEAYLVKLGAINFSIYLTDSEKTSRDMKTKLDKEKADYVIITQNRGIVEEYASTIAAKLYFMKKGYLIGQFEIPVKNEYDIGCGQPDIVGIKGGFVDKLKERGIIPNGGDESDFLIWNATREEPTEKNELEIIVCEVKSSSAWNEAFKKMYKRKNNNGYLKSNCFNKAYACFGAVYNENERKPKAEFEAGALIFANDPESIIFNEDTIIDKDKASSCRRAPSVGVQALYQLNLLKLANKKIARLMISHIPSQKIIPDIDKLRINEVCKRIEAISIENVLKSINIDKL